ncbi:Amino acid transporter [Lachnospiraceae bacterium XBB1006]|nr:Amino acid transporter [Lachnospiraceae bacterium XBB1006]
MSNEKKKLSLVALILMIFTSVYGFNNMPRSFYLMGYGAIPFYVISAIIFFVPFAFMIAEYGSAFKDEKGGIFSWMEKSVNTKYAFVATFMWYTSYVIWLVNISSGIMVPVSNAIFGQDTTGNWSLFGLNAPQTLGILGVVFILVVTFFSSKGLDKIKVVSTVGGIACMALNVLLIGGALIVWIGNGGKLLQHVPSMSKIFVSPNPALLAPISVLGFLVYALFAFGGTEAVGGLVDQTENPEKNFGKGLTIAAFIIAIGYAIGIFCVGIFTNWDATLSSEAVHKGNASYVIMNNLGFQLGKVFGMNKAGCVAFGNGIARFMGISILCSLAGAVFTLIYAPLKQLIEGAPEGLLPAYFCKMEDGMPKNAMKIQCAVVVVMDLLIGMGGDAMAQFFNVLVSMTNVAMTLPYLFISGAFIAFKRNKNIQKSFVVFKNDAATVIFTVLVTATVAFANVFTIIEPAMNGDMQTTIWSIVGPVLFTVIALVLHARYEKNK